MRRVAENADYGRSARAWEEEGKKFVPRSKRLQGSWRDTCLKKKGDRYEAMRSFEKSSRKFFARPLCTGTNSFSCFCSPRTPSLSRSPSPPQVLLSQNLFFHTSCSMTLFQGFTGWPCHIFALCVAETEKFAGLNGIAVCGARLESSVQAQAARAGATGSCSSWC